MPPPAGHPAPSPGRGTVSPGGGANMWGEMPTPPTSGVMCGIGCNINVNPEGDLFVTKVIPGGPAAFSCEIAVNDVLVAVDGVAVKGETPDEVAKRIVGPEGVPICITTRVRRIMQDGTLEDVDKPVTLIRQPPVHMPERLCEGPVGLGIDLIRLENGDLQVRRLQSGGAAQITGKLRVGDVVTRINTTDVATLGPRFDPAGLVLGDPFTRVALTVQSTSGGPARVVHVVRTVVLLGEYLMKFKAYENHLDHAILIPTPPPRESPHMVAPVQQPQRRQPTRQAPPVQRELAGDASCGEFAKGLMEAEASGLSNVRSGGDGSVADATRSTEVPEGWLSHLGQMRQNAADCGSPSLASTNSADETHNSYVSSRASNSVDGMVSRSSTRSTCSRDSIAPVVKETFGDLVDKLRTVEGRESTFEGWPHAGKPRLSPEAMARAGFLYSPDNEAADKVLCAYCGLELAHWEEDDDPHSAHEDSSPGCSFWRKSSTSGQRLSREMFSGYGSPYHSMFRSAGAELAIPSLPTTPMDSVLVST